MKQSFAIIFALSLVLGFSLMSHADLIVRGTDNLGNQLIYDSDLNITWYDYTMPWDTWQNHMAWADALSVTFGSTVFADWRLPTVNDIGNDGCYYGYSGTDCGYNVDTKTGEMAYLWYDELSNLAYYDTSGSGPQPGWGQGLINTGPFQNLLPRFYWSGTEYYTPYTYYAWGFDTTLGYQIISDKALSVNAIAVRDGDVAVVPEPISSILFITGGTLLAGRRLLRRKV